MTNKLWINLPVKDVLKSKVFFTQLGFLFNKRFENSDECAGLMIGENNCMIMLFKEASFKGFTQNQLTDAEKSTEVLFSFDAESREEVDTMAKKVAQAGGKIYAQPSEKDGWMYGFGFTDLDNHRWNMLYMDMSKINSNK